MLLLRLWNYLRGYVMIVVEGYFLEKFINICIHRQIFLWDVKRLKNCTMTLKISIKGFKLIRPVARKTNCRVRIMRKRGMPFVLNRYRKRKAFVFGAVAFLLLIYVLSSFIWTIEVTGNKKLDTQLILDKLASYGVRNGTVKFNVDTDRIAENMMMDTKELAWVGVLVKGTKVKVEVVERILPPDILPSHIPCNVVAAKDGLVKSVIVKTGMEAVKAGDTVKAGQILISGTVPIKSEQGRNRTVHAIGTVMARTWYEKTCPVDFITVEEERTGKKFENYSLVLFGKRLNLFFPGKFPYENFDRVEIKKKLSIGEDLVFPFELIIDSFFEKNIYEREVSQEEAKQIAANRAHEDVLQDVPENAQIVKTDLNFRQKDTGELTADVIVECIEDIGITEEIGGN